MDSPWRIELFGSLQMRQGSQTVARFQTYKTGALLAFLAFHRGTSVSREALADLLWPDADPDSGRNSLRVALASLRRQLEPTGVPVGAILVADRVNVRLNPDAFVTDVLDFESALACERQAEDPVDAEQFLVSAAECYRGPLLSNYYEAWITPERERLADAYLGALRRLTKRLVEARDLDRAIDFAQRAVAADPLREGAHRDLMRLYAAVGRPAAALQQYQELVKLFKEELGAAPGAATEELFRQLSSGISRMPGAAAGAPPAAVPTHEHWEAEPPRPDPRPTTAAAAIGGVPLQFTRFFGREGEIAEILNILQPDSPDGTRLVTLTGPGGGGKTRLGIEVAARLRDAYDGRAWFVDLADTVDAGVIVDTVAAALRITLIPGISTLDQVAEALGSRPCLLLLDNFEQVADAGALQVERILSRIPSCRCLVTSQRRLDLVGEHEISLSPLPVPATDTPVSQLATNPSVRLFVDRAQAARPDFILTERNAPAIAALCTGLEGIPLAIELAAAWSQMLTPAQMLERISDRFELLVSPRKRGLARHRTLRAAVDWSYGLLLPELQATFAALSVFRGGWDIDAAAAVCENSDIMYSLLQLRQRSLILATEQSGGIRFRMLESLRAYADGQLTGEMRQHVGDAHAAYYAEIVRGTGAGVLGTESRACMDRLEEEHANIRAAMDWCLQAGDLEPLVIMASCLWRFWYARGHAGEGRRWLDKLLVACTDTRPPELWHALYGAGFLAAAQGDYSRACAAYETAMLVAAQSGMPRDLTLVANYASASRSRGDVATARRLRAEILTERRSASLRWDLAAALDECAGLALQQGDTAEAAALYREALDLRQALGDQWGEADAWANIASLAALEGDAETEQEANAKAQELFFGLADGWGIAASFLNLGQVAAEQGELPVARALILDGLAQARELGNSNLVAIALLNLAQVALRQSDCVYVRQLAEEGAHIYRSSGDAAGLHDSLQLALMCANQEGDLLTAQLISAEMRMAASEIGAAEGLADHD